MRVLKIFLTIFQKDFDTMSNGFLLSQSIQEKIQSISGIIPEGLFNHSWRIWEPFQNDSESSLDIF